MLLSASQEDWHAFLACVVRTITICVVHRLHIHSPRPEFGIRNIDDRELAFVNRRHHAALPFRMVSKAIVPKVLAIILSMKSGSPDRSS